MDFEEQVEKLKERGDLTMGEVYESIMHGLQEAIDDASGKKRYPRRKMVVEPVKEYSADEVKKIRKSTGMSQYVFAEYMGISVKTVEAWEAGRNHPSGSSSRLLSMMEINSHLTEEYPFVKTE